jgi:hypothetical protein
VPGAAKAARPGQFGRIWISQGRDRARAGNKLFFCVTIQLTSDLPDSGVKSAHIRLYTARFILVLEQIRGNLNRYQ